MITFARSFNSTSRAVRAVLTVGLLVGGASSLACKVNEYCLNCSHDAADGDAKKDAAIDAAAGDGGGDGGPCTPTNNGIEICDGLDNDCNGHIDDGTLPLVGDACGSNVGECTTGTNSCVNGAIKCSGHPPGPELCNNKDDNCNGVVDEGDPESGTKCGMLGGECVQGTNHCVNGALSCLGAVGPTAEVCDGKDNDCNGTIDDGIPSLGTCGTSNVGECKFGTLSCVGGGTLCSGAIGPTFELCDGKDNDCDGVVDNGYNLNTDALNCGMCGHDCSADPLFLHAVAGCGAGLCKIAACQPGYYDLDHNPANGCEYGPCQIQGSVEACNGLDDNCNGQIDENLTPPSICLTKGACAGSGATCGGAAGWSCNYGPNVSVDATGHIIPETTCDGIDNDCNGIIDDAQANKGKACVDSGVGVCQGSGTFTCDPANLTGPAICAISTPGQTAGPEICNGLDDNCNGAVDEGTLIGQEWVTITGGTTQIMKYEASRPDATALSGGAKEAMTCSRSGVLPWVDLTYPQAVAACTAAGARLCTEAEWQSACTMATPPASVTYPVLGPASAIDGVIIEAENAQTIAPATSGGTLRTWSTTTATAGYSGTAAMIATPNTGANVSAANAPTQSPRLDFSVNFQQAGTYYVWVRMYGGPVVGADDAVWVGINASVPGTASTQNLTAAAAWRWALSAPLTGVTAGTNIVSVYMRRDGVQVDAIAVSMDGTAPPGSFQWSYSTNPTIASNTTCNAQPYDTNPATPLVNDDDTLPTGSMAACFANGPGTNDAYDLSGNVKEWTKARAAGQNPIRGGAANSPVNGTTCELNFTLADDTFFFPNVGFRCCK